MGAGSIGCTVGGRLLAGGQDVVFVGRESLGEELGAKGLTLTSYRGEKDTVTIAPERVRWATTVDALAEASPVLVTVKGLATAEVGAELASVLQPDAVVVSLQNGVQNADALREVLGGRRVCAGMVPFNVRRQGNGRFHQGTSGALLLSAADSPLGFVDAMKAGGLAAKTHPANKEAAAMRASRIQLWRTASSATGGSLGEACAALRDWRTERA